MVPPVRRLLPLLLSAAVLACAEPLPPSPSDHPGLPLVRPPGITHWPASGYFRAPDLMRFGFSPLYLSFAEIDRAADALVQILVTRSWDQPRFTARRTVT